MSTNNNTITFADKIGIPTTNISICIPEVVKILKTGKVPCLHGEAGIGKTASMNQLAKLLNKPIFTFICSHMSETDMGIPFRSEGNTNHFDMLPPEQVYKAISSESGAVLFFDEITRADKATLNAIFAVISERRVGSTHLNDNVDIVCACNPDDGEYSVNDIISDPAWRRRLIHMWLETDALAWLLHAKRSGFNPEVINYIESKPHMLIGLEARAAGKVYPNPAAWETVSRYMNANNNQLSTIAISGMIGYDVARDFSHFVVSSTYRVTPSEILMDYDGVKPILDTIKADGRGDILSEISKSVVMYLVMNQPRVEDAGPNLYKFWASLPEENIIVLSQEMERENRGANVNYFTLLYGEFKKQPGWSKHLNKVKGIVRIK